MSGRRGALCSRAHCLDLQQSSCGVKLLKKCLILMGSFGQRKFPRYCRKECVYQVGKVSVEYCGHFRADTKQVNTNTKILTPLLIIFF